MKKIMLCCNAGMSTSLLVQKMQAEVANRGLDIEVEARPMNEAHDHPGRVRHVAAWSADRLHQGRF